MRKKLFLVQNRADKTVRFGWSQRPYNAISVLSSRYGRVRLLGCFADPVGFDLAVLFSDYPKKSRWYVPNDALLEFIASNQEASVEVRPPRMPSKVARREAPFEYKEGMNWKNFLRRSRKRLRFSRSRIDELPEIMSLNQLAGILGVSTSMVSRWIEKEDFPVTDKGPNTGAYVLEKTLVVSWLRDRKYIK